MPQTAASAGRGPTGRIFDIKRFAVHDGPGIRTTVFLKGCSLRCAWCHNPEGISSAPQLAYLERKCESCGECVRACPNGVHEIADGEHLLHRERCTLCGRCIEACMPAALVYYGREISVEECTDLILADRDFYGSSGGGATFSGGEPLLQADFVAAVMENCRREGIDTALDTCAAVPWSAFEKVLPFTDRVLFDIKHADPAAHRTWTGMGNEPIWENLSRLGERDVPIEIRIPCVPGVNTDDDVIRTIGSRLSGIPSVTGVRPLAYHDFARSKYRSLGMEDTMPRVELPDAGMMDRIREILAGYGLTVLQ